MSDGFKRFIPHGNVVEIAVGADLPRLLHKATRIFASRTTHG